MLSKIELENELILSLLSGSYSRSEFTKDRFFLYQRSLVKDELHARAIVGNIIQKIMENENL